MSTPLVFVDTGLLIAAFDDGNATQRDAARAWLLWCWQTRSGRISTQVLNNFYHQATSRFQTAQTPELRAAVRTQVRHLRQWQPPHLDRFTIDGAWALQDRHQLIYWDALVLASAQQQGCSHVLSAELRSKPAIGAAIDGLSVLNPFETLPADLENA
jgi:predicted nucleic acid-binding protein